ncbi:hypothetical protein E4U32_004418 [Claviceps aff. humidiphila group G2b]|nr:hypothetical protein E4U32_004418 [Claviceps aff. humidiphila group G2b]
MLGVGWGDGEEEENPQRRDRRGIQVISFDDSTIEAADRPPFARMTDRLSPQSLEKPVAQRRVLSAVVRNFGPGLPFRLILVEAAAADSYINTLYYCVDDCCVDDWTFMALV